MKYETKEILIALFGKKTIEIFFSILILFLMIAWIWMIGFAIFEAVAEKGWLGDRLMMWQINKQPTLEEKRKYKTPYNERYEDPTFYEFHHMPQ